MKHCIMNGLCAIMTRLLSAMEIQMLTRLATYRQLSVLFICACQETHNDETLHKISADHSLPSFRLMSLCWFWGTCSSHTIWAKQSTSTVCITCSYGWWLISFPKSAKTLDAYNREFHLTVSATFMFAYVWVFLVSFITFVSPLVVVLYSLFLL